LSTDRILSNFWLMSCIVNLRSELSNETGVLYVAVAMSILCREAGKQNPPSPLSKCTSFHKFNPGMITPLKLK